MLLAGAGALVVQADRAFEFDDGIAFRTSGVGKCGTGLGMVGGQGDCELAADVQQFVVEVPFPGSVPECDRMPGGVRIACPGRCASLANVQLGSQRTL